MRCGYFALSLIFISNLTFAETIEKVEFDPIVTVGNSKLHLNGVGLRKATKFGLDFKVYVAGLYTAKPAKSLDEVLSSGEPKQLRMVFLRRVSVKDINEAYFKGLADNCMERCSEAKAGMKQLTAVTSDMLDRSSIIYTFNSDSVEYDIKARKDAKGTINGKAFSQALLAVFIGSKPPSEKLKDGLLGIEN